MILVIQIIKLYLSRSFNNRILFNIVLLRYKYFHDILLISMTFSDLEIGKVRILVHK